MARSVIKRLLVNNYKFLGGVKSTDVPTGGSYTLNLAESLDKFRLIRLNTSYYTAGQPDYGGATITPQMLNKIEPVLVRNHYPYPSDNRGYMFSVYLIDSNSLRITFSGTPDDINCLSVRSIL